MGADNRFRTRKTESRLDLQAAAHGSKHFRQAVFTAAATPCTLKTSSRGLLLERLAVVRAAAYFLRRHAALVFPWCRIFEPIDGRVWSSDAGRRDLISPVSFELGGNPAHSSQLPRGPNRNVSRHGLRRRPLEGSAAMDRGQFGLPQLFVTIGQCGVQFWCLA